MTITNTRATQNFILKENQKKLQITRNDNNNNNNNNNDDDDDDDDDDDNKI